jgi:hypothetical protein
MTIRATALALLVVATLGASEAAAVTFAGPTSSQPLALDAAGTLLGVVNPDNDRVSFFDVAGDRNKRIKRLKGGRRSSASCSPSTPGRRPSRGSEAAVQRRVAEAAARPSSGSG